MRTELLDFLEHIKHIIDQDKLVENTNSGGIYRYAYSCDVSDWRYYFYYYDNGRLLHDSLLIEKCDLLDPKKSGIFDVMTEIGPKRFSFYHTTTMKKCFFNEDILTINTEEDFFQKSTLNNYADLEYNDLQLVLDFRQHILDQLEIKSKSIKI